MTNRSRNAGRNWWASSHITNTSACYFHLLSGYAFFDFFFALSWSCLDCRNRSYARSFNTAPK